MPSMIKSPLFLTILGLTLGLTGYYFFLTDEPVDYNAEIKPIINQKCISCHGGVRQKGGFSLLFRDEALSPTASGKPAIIPGDAKNSEMIRRLYHKDLEERMPYKEEPLSKQEIKLLTRWIDEGAKFETHWAYKSVQQQKIPGGGFFSFFDNDDENDIDFFIIKKLDENN